MRSINVKALIQLVVIIMITTSCSDKSNLYIGDVTANIKFPVQVELSGKQITLDTTLQMGIYDISVVDDIIIAKYSSKPYFYYCFDKSTFSPIKEFLLKGRGYNEFTAPYILKANHYDSLNNLILHIEDPNLKTIYKADLTSYLNGEDLQLEKITKLNSGQSFPEFLNDHEIIVRNYNLSDNNVYLDIFGIKDNTKNKQIQLNRFPISEMFRNDMFIMTTKPNGEKVAMAVLAMNQLMILDVASGTNRIYTTDNKTIKWEDIVGAEDWVDHYLDIACTNDYILVVKNNTENPDLNGFVLQVWDWNGNPVKEAFLKNISPIDVAFDLKDKKLYAITEDEKVWIYNIEGV